MGRRDEDNDCGINILNYNFSSHIMNFLIQLVREWRGKGHRERKGIAEILDSTSLIVNLESFVSDSSRRNNERVPSCESISAHFSMTCSWSVAWRLDGSRSNCNWLLEFLGHFPKVAHHSPIIHYPPLRSRAWLRARNQDLITVIQNEPLLS